MTPTQTPRETIHVGDRVRRGKRGKEGEVFSDKFAHIGHVDVLFDGDKRCTFTALSKLTLLSRPAPQVVGEGGEGN